MTSVVTKVTESGFFDNARIKIHQEILDEPIWKGREKQREMIKIFRYPKTHFEEIKANSHD